MQGKKPIAEGCLFPFPHSYIQNMLKVIILTLCGSLALADVQQQALRGQLSQKLVVAEASVQASVVNPVVAEASVVDEEPMTLLQVGKK